MLNPTYPLLNPSPTAPTVLAMHEVSIMEQTMQVALENARSQDAIAIHLVRMRVGVGSGVVPEALKFAFDVVTKGTIAEGANLEIETVPIACRCAGCGIEFQPLDPFFYQCPGCGQLSSTLIAGRDVELASLEIS